jgi:hypothetical protein
VQHSRLVRRDWPLLTAATAVLLITSMIACGSPTRPEAPTMTPSTLPVSYDSPDLGYHVQLPAGYRLSDCLSVWQSQDPTFVADIFTPLSVDEERALERGHVAGGGAVAARTIAISVTNADSRPALEWAREYGNFGGAERHEARTIAGYEAARTTVNKKVVLFVVRADERVYLLATRPESPLPEALLDSVASSFRPTVTGRLPPPVPSSTGVPQGAHNLAAELGTALERADAATLARLVPPRCWIETWSAATGPLGRAAAPFVADLRTRLQAGLLVMVDRTVQVAPRTGPSGMRLFVASIWTEATRVTRANLYLRQLNGQWFWGGVEALPPP